MVHSSSYAWGKEEGRLFKFEDRCEAKNISVGARCIRKYRHLGLCRFPTRNEMFLEALLEQIDHLARSINSLLDGILGGVGLEEDRAPSDGN